MLVKHKITIQAINQQDSLTRIFSVLRYHGLQVERATIEKVCPETLLIIIVCAKDNQDSKRDRVIKNLNKLVVTLEVS